VAFSIVWLALADRLVDPALSFLERERYERGRVFRFENSDLFGLGPLVDYLREHPGRERPRTLFFGNSVVWGYGLSPDSALPAQFQKLEPAAKTFNVSINGFDMGSSYLIARAVIGSVDRLYVLQSGAAADPILPSLIPIDAEDLRFFKLPQPDRIERAFERSLDWWHLYRSTYRLQAALFGSSTRQYVYLHKRELASAAFARLHAGSPSGSSNAEENATIEILRPAGAPPSSETGRSFQERYPLMWRFGELARTHGKRTVFLRIEGYAEAMLPEAIAAFNQRFGPGVEILVLRIPGSLRFDGLHLTAEGSAALAATLVRHERAQDAVGR
jgi:hypothetical protein